MINEDSVKLTIIFALIAINFFTTIGAMEATHAITLARNIAGRLNEIGGTIWKTKLDDDNFRFVCVNNSITKGKFIYDSGSIRMHEEFIVDCWVDEQQLTRIEEKNKNNQLLASYTQFAQKTYNSYQKILEAFPDTEMHLTLDYKNKTTNICLGEWFCDPQKINRSVVLNVDEVLALMPSK